MAFAVDADDIFVDGEEEELKEAIGDSVVESDTQSFQKTSKLTMSMKFDLNESAKNMARTEDCGYMPTSARTGYNTQEAFEELCRMILIAQGSISQTALASRSTVPQAKMLNDENPLTHSMKLRAES